MLKVGTAIEGLKRLGVEHTDEEVKRSIIVRDDGEYGLFALPQLPDVQIIRAGDGLELWEVEDGEPDGGRQQNGFRGFSRRLFENFVLLNRDVLGARKLQIIEQDIKGTDIIIAVLLGIAVFYKVHHGGEVLFLGWGLVFKIQKESRDKGGFRFLLR